MPSFFNFLLVQSFPFYYSSYELKIITLSNLETSSTHMSLDISHFNPSLMAVWFSTAMAIEFSLFLGDFLCFNLFGFLDRQEGSVLPFSTRDFGKFFPVFCFHLHVSIWQLSKSVSDGDLSIPLNLKTQVSKGNLILKAKV